LCKKPQNRNTECNHYLKGTEDQGQDQDLQMNSTLREQGFMNRRPNSCSAVVLPISVRAYSSMHIFKYNIKVFSISRDSGESTVVNFWKQACTAL
ncbi:hypothetical protein J6590_105098, partial [Homalodisca vitripennis]